MSDTINVGTSAQEVFDDISSTSIAARMLTLDTASGITRVDGDVGGTDTRDAYRFTAPASGIMSAVLSGTTDAYHPELLYLQIVDESSTVRGTSSYDSTLAEKRLTTPVEAGKSYVVYVAPIPGLPSTDLTSRYILDIDTMTPDEIDNPQGPDTPEIFTDFIDGTPVAGRDAPDGLEPELVVSLNGFGLATITGTVGYENSGVHDDADVYTFTAIETGTMSLNLGGLQRTVNLILSDAQGVELARTENLSGATSKNLFFDVDAGQKYTVSVIDYYTSESPYVLTIDLPPDGTAFDSVNETPVENDDAPNSVGGSTNLPVLTFHDEEGVVGNVTGSVGGEDTADYYSVRIPQTSKDITFTLNSSTAAVYVVGVGTDNADILTTDFTFLSQSEYTLRVQSMGEGVAEYAFSFELTDPPVNIDDQVNNISIGDAGNTVDDKSPVQAVDGRIDIEGSLNGGNGDNFDYYTFTAWVSGTYTFDFTNDTGFYATLTHEGTQVKNTTNDGNKFTCDLATGSEYIFSVRSFSLNPNGAYSLEITPQAGTGEAPDDIINGTAAGDVGGAEAPYAINSQQPFTANGTVGTSADGADYYLLTLPAHGGDLSVSMGGLDAVDIALVTDGESQSLDDFFAAPQSFPYAPGDSYLLAVTSASGQAADYQLSFDIDPYIDLVNGQAVDNGDFGVSAETSTAPSFVNNRLQIDGTLQAGVDDADSFQIAILTPGDYRVQLAGLESVDLLLNGEQLTIGDANGQFSQNLTLGEGFALTFSPKAGIQNKTNYSLSLDLIPPTPEVPQTINDRQNDAAGTLALATEVAFGTQVLGGFNLGDAGDCFKLTPAENRQLTVTLAGLEQPLDLQAYDHAGTLLASASSFTSGDRSFTLNVMAGSPYYFVVDPFQGSASDYMLTFA